MNKVTRTTSYHKYNQRYHTTCLHVSIAENSAKYPLNIKKITLKIISEYY